MHFFGSITRNLYLIVLVSMLPILAVTLYMGLDRRTRTMDETLAQAYGAVKSLSTHSEQLIDTTRALLLTLAKTDIRKNNLRVAQNFFSSIIEKNPWHTDLFLVDTAGEVLISSNPGISPPNQQQTEEFRQAMAEKRFVITGVVPNSTAGRSALRFAMPVLDENGEIISILTGSIFADQHLTKLIDKHLPPNAQVRLVDAKGNLLYAYPANSLSEEARRYERDKVLAENLPLGHVSVTLPNKEKRLVFYGQLFLPEQKTPYLLAILTLPDALARGEANRSLFNDMALLIGATLTAFFIVHSAGKRMIIRPIHSLLAAVTLLKRGNFAVEPHIGALHGDMRTLAANIAQMAEALAMQTRALLQAKQAALQDNAVKTAFLTTMSHSIRTPMNAVIGLSYLILKTSLPDKSRNYFHKIYRASSTLLGIINDVVAFSRMEMGTLQISNAPFDITELFDNISTLIGQKAEEKELQLIFSIDPAVPQYLFGDALRLGQILTNLGNNAVKFTKTGSITITCDFLPEGPESTSPLSGAPSTANSKGVGVSQAWLRFCVSDTGIGMTPAQQSRVFEMFTQAEDSTSRVFGGTGLGLNIAKRFIELMGGNIVLQSTPGRGTNISFSLCFDLASAPQSEQIVCQPLQRPAEIPAISLPTGTHILVVEDNQINQQIVVELLESVNVRASVANNGEEAVNLLESSPVGTFSLVLMDLQMPKMDGYTATQLIRRHECFKSLPIIAMTAHAMVEEQMRCREAGMNEHIAKPIEITTFFEKLCFWCAPSQE